MPVVMVAMAALLAVLPAISAFIPHLAGSAQAAAERFVDTAGYARAVLDGEPSDVVRACDQTGITLGSLVIGTCTALAAVAIALAALSADRIPRSARHFMARLVRPLVALHSGDVRDYIAWLVFGTTLLAIFFRLAIL